MITRLLGEGRTEDGMDGIFLYLRAHRMLLLSFFLLFLSVFQHFLHLCVTISLSVFAHFLAFFKSFDFSLPLDGWGFFLLPFLFFEGTEWGRCYVRGGS